MLRFFVEVCAYYVKNGNNKTCQKIHDLASERASADKRKHCSDNGENNNDDAPNEAGVCFFGLFAVRNADDARNKLNYASEKADDAGSIKKSGFSCRSGCDSAAPIAIRAIIIAIMLIAPPIIIRMPVTLRKFFPFALFWSIKNSFCFDTGGYIPAPSFMRGKLSFFRCLSYLSEKHLDENSFAY